MLNSLCNPSSTSEESETKGGVHKKNKGFEQKIGDEELDNIEENGELHNQQKYIRQRKRYFGKKHRFCCQL